MRLVISTAPTGEAPALARALVEERLAACVNVLPKVRSIYSWEGEICDDEESVLLVKTTEERCVALTKRLKELHSYDVPEIICLEIDKDHSSADYMSWMTENVSDRTDNEP